MKKINYFFLLLCVACVFGSCAVGTYVPHAVNVIGTQTTVVLDKANFRVVRSVEAVVEVDNDRLRRADVEKSAFAELTRKYPLTGSQTYINVVFEEVQREKVFAFHSGRYKLKQYVAVRATIIEFLQDNGQPIPSVESPYNTAPRYAQIEQEISIEYSPNKCYLAWLLKTGQLTRDKNKQSELNEKYPLGELIQIMQSHSEYDLLKMMNGYDRNLKNYEHTSN